MVEHAKATFVRFKDVFHPESASPSCCTISSNGTDGTTDSKWSVVWAEAKLIPDAEPYSGMKSSSTELLQEDKTEILVEAIPPSNTSSSNQVGGKNDFEGDHNDENNNVNQKPSNSDAPNSHSEQSMSSPYSKANFLDLVFGVSLTIGALSSVLGIEIAGAVVCMVAFGFHVVAEYCKKGGPIFWLVYILFMITFWSLMLVDAILLTTSVLVSEILAGIAYFLTLLSGGCDVAKCWHQYIRRLCHILRWACRETPKAHAREKVKQQMGNICSSGQQNATSNSCEGRRSETGKEESDFPPPVNPQYNEKEEFQA